MGKNGPLPGKIRTAEGGVEGEGLYQNRGNKTPLDHRANEQGVN